MALSVRALVQFAASLTNSQDLSSGSSETPFGRQFSFADGTGLNQANRIWADARTLAASASEDLDLSGTLTDAFGATITLQKVKGLIVAAASTNTNNVVIGGAAATQWVGPFGAATHTLAVQPGGVLALFTPAAAGYPVTPTTDLLKVANSGAGTPVTYQIVIVGTN
jgi:hypothetical protein